MKIILLTLTLLLAHAGSKEESQDTSDQSTVAKSVDQENCFSCNSGVTDGTKAEQKKVANERATDVYGKAAPGSGDGDSNAVKEGK